ncbi:hypothetical protein QZH46_02595 [Pseudomonas corrugata]
MPGTDLWRGDKSPRRKSLWRFYFSELTRIRLLRRPVGVSLPQDRDWQKCTPAFAMKPINRVVVSMLTGSQPLRKKLRGTAQAVAHILSK